MTKEEARKNLPEWLERAAINPIFNEYDKLCREAMDVLGEEYQPIYNRWAKQYTLCTDGLYRRF